MIEKDWNYKLFGIVEMDECFVGAAGEGGKRGRGTDKAKVLIGLSLARSGGPLNLKMETAKDLTYDSVSTFTLNGAELGGAITTDGFKAYPPLSGIGFRHLPKVYDPKDESEHLKWIRIIIGNAKAFILGTCHGLA
jgi:hypothetical protein